MRKTVLGLVVVFTMATLATLAACATPAPDGAAVTPTGTPAIQASWTSCAVNGTERFTGDGDAIALPRLGEGFVPTAAIVCATQPQRRADGGEDLVATERRAQDVTALVAALRLPDESRTTRACTLDLPIVDWFALLDAAGRWLRPGLPTDACGKIRMEVREAVAELRLTTVSSHPVAEVESADAVAAGCQQSWADMIGAEVSLGRAGSGSAFTYPLRTATRVRVCVYRVPTEQQGSGKPAGDFEYGGVLEPEQRAQIEEGLMAAGSARPCTAHAGRFALMGSADAGDGGQVYVELDGCQRIMADPAGSPVFAQADPTTVALLAKR